MTQIAIVGGHGQIARELIPRLVAAGHTPVALVRNDSQVATVEKLGATARRLDIEAEEAGAFAAAFEGCHAVVFAAGGGPDGNIERKRTVDLEGSLKSIDGAKQAGIARFVQISAIGVDLPLPEDADPVWQAYVEAKRDADAALRGSGLDWTILRPGMLTDDEPTGEVTVAESAQRGEIPRGDVAAVAAEVLDSGNGIGRQWDVVGGSASVADAVSSA
ncbi:SDR family oxidoreductase [Aeromicrobium sp. CF4.19]|uniref:SDR family oxidoreductase n=1 Tax=Aeromicrobium sp. CF4.19 TaxID=3373082 RepID=UPI003EE4305F